MCINVDIIIDASLLSGKVLSLFSCVRTLRIVFIFVVLLENLWISPVNSVLRLSGAK